MRRLSDTLIVEEELNKSELIREIIEKYNRNCREKNKYEKKNNTSKSLITVYKSLINDKSPKHKRIQRNYTPCDYLYKNEKIRIGFNICDDSILK